MAQDYLEAQRQLREQIRKNKLMTAGQTAPPYDRSADVLYYSGRTNLPTDVVDADLDNIRERVDREEFDYQNYTDERSGSPIFNDWAAENPYHPHVVERDRENLNLLERQGHALGIGWDRGEAMTELARISNRRAQGEKYDDDEQIMADLRELVEAGDFGLEGWASVLVETGVQGKVQTHILGESWEMAALGAGTGAAIGATGLGAGALPGAAVGFGLGWRAGAFDASRLLEQGLAYDEYLQLGASEKEAKAVAQWVGVANGALEMVGINAIIKTLPGARRIQGQTGKALIERLISRPTFGGAVKRLGARYGEAMATEIVTEVIQETLTMVGAEKLKGDMRAVGDMRPELAPMSLDEWFDAMGHVIEQTMKGTAIIGGIGPGTRLVGDLRRAKHAKANGAWLKGMGEATQKSELRKDKRVHGKYMEFLQRMSEKGPVKEIRFDLDTWRSYWEAQDVDVEQLGTELGLDMEALEATGADVVLNLETFGEKIAHTDHFNKELWKDARLHQDDMSYREQRAFFSNPEEHVKKLKADLEETFGVHVSDDYERIVTDLTGQLMAGGNYDRSAAESQAKLHASVWTTQALRNPQAGVTPWNLYKSRLTGVRFDPMGTAAPPNAFDPHIDPLLDRIRNNDFPTQRQIFGDSLSEFIAKNGKLLDEGGELSARDFQKVFRGLVSEEGRSHDDMAELAYEQGYIPARDPNLLLEMLDREAAGDPVFSAQFTDPNLQTIAHDIESLADFLDQEGINVNELSNREIREILDSRTRFDQMDDEQLKSLTDTIVATLEDTESESYAQDIANLSKRVPLLSDHQDFRGIVLEERVREADERGTMRPGTRRTDVQKQFDWNIKRRNMLKKLMDCVNG